MENPIKAAIAIAKTQDRFLSNAEILQQGNNRIKKAVASLEAAQLLSVVASRAGFARGASKCRWKNKGRLFADALIGGYRSKLHKQVYVKLKANIERIQHDPTI